MSFLRFAARKSPLGQVLSRFSSTGRRYTKKHEWVLVDNGVGTVGITDFAAEQLGDLVYVELPQEGDEISRGDSTGAVESVKAASDVYAPISGTVVELNSRLEEEAGLVNKSPFEKGWLYKLKVKSADELNELLSEEQYNEFKQNEEASAH
ncbi:unnamed protein product [Caenorhabditis bovis]|uniref:Glycine cleavage system H protein n=1 Tax=Caenorhabditis bovis TaxID=2654633 RepID=A0A8S1ETY8_9PELO|nr:unnamed protein product [Caenorhabditis bovis]